MKKYLLATTISTLSLLITPSISRAENSKVLERINQLEQEIQILKRQQEVNDEKVKAQAEKTANVELGSKGLKISSPDKNYEFSIRGYAQADSRQFINDKSQSGSKLRDDFLIRRARPVIEAKNGNGSFRLMPDFGGSSVRVFDAHADYKFNNLFQVRAGKFKPPVGLERLQSATDTFFAERGHPTNLAPNRDIGVQVSGNPIADILEYQVGVFNGTPDLGNTEGDTDNKKDLVGRVFSTPFRNSSVVALQGLGLGVAGSIGDRQGSTTNTQLPSYKTPGQQDFFKYLSDAFADGKNWRLYPQLYLFNGNLGLIAEYALASQTVKRTTRSDELKNRAWQIAASWVITGEDVNFRGGVKPTNNFDISKNKFGAFELVARVGATEIDKDAFPIFANRSLSAREAKSYGLGLNWHLNDSIKFVTNYDKTKFTGGAASGKDRKDEDIVITRVQYRF